MKTLSLMRHGETMFNVRHRIQGWCDSPLTENGRAQAHAMGTLLRGVMGLDAAMNILREGWGNCTTCVYAFDEEKAGTAPDGNGAGPWRFIDVLRLL